MANETAERIRQYVITTFLLDDAAAMPANDASLLKHGIIDSTGVLELVLFMEEEFGISVADEEVVPENFDSVDNLAAYAQSKRAVTTA